MTNTEQRVERGTVTERQLRRTLSWLCAELDRPSTGDPEDYEQRQDMAREAAEIRAALNW